MQKQLDSAIAQNSTLTVNCDFPLGAASQIGDFMCAGSSPVDVVSPDDPLALAWRNLGMRHSEFPQIDQYPEVSRNPNSGQMQLDFTRYDALLSNAYNILQSIPVIDLKMTPPALSSQPTHEYAATFMPRDLEEWKDFVYQVVRHTRDWLDTNGHRDQVAFYGAMEEPSWAGQGAGQEGWQPAFYIYHPDDDPYDPENGTLANSIKLYVATWEAAKQADPTAKLGGPATAGWESAPFGSPGQGGCSLEGWLQALQQYQNSHPQAGIGLDYVVWQDYGYVNGKLSEGADAARAYLQKMQWPHWDTIPFLLNTGAGGGRWSSAYYVSMPDHQRASYIIYTFVREFTGGDRSRKFAGASYYVFVTAAARPTPTALVWEHDGPPVYYSYTPMYAAFQVMHLLQQETSIVETSIVGDNLIEAMTTYSADPKRVRVVVNNHTASPQSVHMVVNLPADFTSDDIVHCTIQRIDASHSPTIKNSCNVLEAGRIFHSQVNNNQVIFDIDDDDISGLPEYSAALIAIVPAPEKG